MTEIDGGDSVLGKIVEILCSLVCSCNHISIITDLPSRIRSILPPFNAEGQKQQSLFEKDTNFEVAGRSFRCAFISDFSWRVLKKQE